VSRYHIPTKFHFGSSSLLDNGDEIAGLGKRALIVTDKTHSRRSKFALFCSVYFGPILDEGKWVEFTSSAFGR